MKPTAVFSQNSSIDDFIDSAHAIGLGVILDVVYNHFGPDGCYAGNFTRRYLSDRYKNEWGEPINFDGPGCEGAPAPP